MLIQTPTFKLLYDVMFCFVMLCYVMLLVNVIYIIEFQCHSN